MVPTDIAGCKLWLKADALALSDNDPVASWTDSSSQANHATEATNKPTFKTAILNGLPVIRFDGTNDILTCGASGNYKHFFIVAKFNGATFSDFNGLISGITASGDDIIFTGAFADSVWYTGGEPFASGNPIYYKNGVLQSNSSPAAPMNAWGILSLSYAFGWTGKTIQIGLDRNNAGRFWNGDVAEIIGYDTQLSDPNRLSVLGYLDRYTTVPPVGSPGQFDPELNIKAWF